MQSNIALYFISESIFSAHFVEPLNIIFKCKFRVLILESFMVQGTLDIHCVCVYAPELKVQKDVMHCFC